MSDFVRRAIGEESEEWGGTFYAPWFTPGEDLIGRGPGSNAGLNHNRTPLYRDLFYELLVQPVEDVDGATVDIVDALLETERQQGGGEEVKRGAELYEFVRALEVFGEGRLPAEVGASLRLVGSAMNVDATMDQAERDAVLAYAAMRGFAEAREKVLWELVEGAGFSDPEMIKGLELAQGEVREELEMTLEELREQARGAAGRGALFEEGFDAIAAGAIGVSVKGVLGASAVAGGLATGVAALAVRQIDRVVTAEDAEARLVLLSTLDRKLFEEMDPHRMSVDEKLLVEQLRRHLSDLAAEAAAEYVENSPPLVREGAHQWAAGHPYYDDAVLQEYERQADISFAYEAEDIPELTTHPAKEDIPIPDKIIHTVTDLGYDNPCIDGNSVEDNFEGPYRISLNNDGKFGYLLWGIGCPATRGRGYVLVFDADTHTYLGGHFGYNITGTLEVSADRVTAGLDDGNDYSTIAIEGRDSTLKLIYDETEEMYDGHYKSR